MGTMNQVLDMSVVEELLSLCDDGDPELLLDLIEMFLDDAPAKVAAIQQGIQGHDLEAVERAAHSLKGSSGNLGATGLQDTCEQLQNVARGHQIREAQALLGGLESHFTAAVDALEQLRQTYSSR
jgi:HPt (histidine-containing phosphotransfer) domain-containing protein